MLIELSLDDIMKICDDKESIYKNCYIIEDSTYVLYLFTKDKPIEWMDSQLKTLALSCFSCCFISFIIGNII